MFTAEAQHGTLAATLIARPSRWVIVTAKAAMATLVGLVLGTTAMIAGFGGALLGGVDLGNTSAIAPRALWALLYTALAAVIGLGVGMIARHSAGAISGLLMWAFVVESLFAPALPDGLVHFLPVQRRLPAPRRRPGVQGPRVHRPPARPSGVRPHLRCLRPGEPGHRDAAPLPA